ncbi:hypothetical protein ABMA28_007978 [Loxostege sticticalis]|uniref:Histone-lysine N-methyltransferase SETMAR n=1 Tax=Loxostege sticticalis TaxID=481309 RepID=A0ABD0SKA3_LOXSC
MKEAPKQPRLINRSRPLLFHENARPIAAQQTITKLDELQLECLEHPPYFSDLAPTDYNFFRNLDIFLQGKKSTPMRPSKPNSRVYRFSPPWLF